MRQVQVRLNGRESYTIEIGADALNTLGDHLRNLLSAHARHAVVISNQQVFDLYGAQAVASLRKADFETTH